MTYEYINRPLTAIVALNRSLLLEKNIHLPISHTILHDNDVVKALAYNALVRTAQRCTKQYRERVVSALEAKNVIIALCYDSYTESWSIRISSPAKGVIRTRLCDSKITISNPGVHQTFIVEGTLWRYIEAFASRRPDNVEPGDKWWTQQSLGEIRIGGTV